MRDILRPPTSMPKSRLAFALEQLALDDWKAFEEFASAFLASEFPDLRTIAGTNDLGRDAVLYQSGTEPDVVLQYSITTDWRSKVLGTVGRLAKKKIKCRVLVYASNQEIGSRADELKSDLRRWRIALDVRDRSYWVERRARSQATRAAAEHIERRVSTLCFPSNNLSSRARSAARTCEQGSSISSCTCATRRTAAPCHTSRTSPL